MALKHRKALLAEHEKDLKDILVYLLSAWDYEVILASDSASVLEKVRREQPDIIIIDYNLQKGDGLSVSKALKEDFLTAHIPVIILINKKQIRKKMLEIEQGVDDYIINPPDPIDLEVRLEMALRRSSHQLHANALTKLPGNRDIEKTAQTRIEEGRILSILYYDIDNFKSFNDKYGYMKGDDIIKHTAYIISTTVKRYGNRDDFVGHIGGDDFVVVTTPERDSIIASESILSFNRLVPFHYNTEDRDRAYVIAKDRRGSITKIPLMSISVAIANNKDYKLQSIVDFMEVISEVKSYLKTLPGSNFLINRRAPAKKEFIHSKSDTVRKEERPKYRPLGQIMVETHILTIQQLETALHKHWSTGQKIGQAVIGLGMASPGDVSRALELQLNIPHFDIRSLDSNGQIDKLIKDIPLDFMKESFVIPVNKEKETISLIMLNPNDVESLDKMRGFTGCNIRSFFVLENEFREIWDRVIKKADKGF